jgi:hypothetical protein
MSEINATRPTHVQQAYDVLKSPDSVAFTLDQLLFALTVVMTYERDQQITDKIKAMEGHQNEVKWSRSLIDKLNGLAKTDKAIVISSTDKMELINALAKNGINLDYPKNTTFTPPNSKTAPWTSITLPAPTTNETDSNKKPEALKKSNEETIKLLTSQLDTKIKELGTSLEMQNLELQQLMSRRTQGIEISTQIQAKLEKAKDSVIRNV